MMGDFNYKTHTQFFNNVKDAFGGDLTKAIEFEHQWRQNYVTEQAIIDLKWSGAKRRKELIMNGEDLQLVLYAKLLGEENRWPHTAYFILEEGEIIA